MVGETIAHYQVLRQIGRGGQGEAYLALDTKLGRPVVIKLLPPALNGDELARDRFLKEARLASQLEHPNICTIHDVSEVDGRLFIVMQYVEGMTLKELIAHRSLPAATALAIALQIADSLIEAHERGIVHRDIKSSNIMITDKGRAVLLDFGLATQRRDARIETTGHPPKLSSPCGTPSYMSPEQVRGEEADARSDIFSFGVILYEMLTGRRPFSGATADEIMTAIVNDLPLPPTAVVPTVDSAFDQIVLKALEKNPADRYHSVAAMRADLSAISTQVGLEDGSGVRALLVEATRKARFGKRLLVISLLSLLAVAILVVIAALFYKKLVTPRNNRPVVSAPESSAPRVVAILPFRNLNNDASSDFLGYALADSVINNLAYVRNLIVRPPAAIEKYRNQPLDLGQVGRELKADTILSGSFAKEEHEIRVNAQLIDVRSNAVLWSDMMNVHYDSLLSLQDMIANRIVHGLQLHLSQEEEERLGRDVPHNSQAYVAFLMSKGLGLMTDETTRAIELLQKSIELDPAYSPTWVELGWRYRQMSLFGLGSRFYYDKAEAAGEQAMKINPDSVSARVLLSFIYADEGRVKEAITLLHRGLEISPNNAELYDGLRYAYRYAGLLQQSIDTYQKGKELDPDFLDRPTNYIVHGYLYIGDYQRFVQTIANKEAPLCYFYRGFGYFHLGETDRALSELDQAIKVDPDNVFSLLATTLKARIEGKFNQGIRILRALEEKREKGGIPDGEMSYKIAQLYAQLGDPTSSLRMLKKAIDQGFYCYPYMARDPLLDPIRPTSEFAKLIDVARRKHEEYKQEFATTPEQEQ